MPKMKVYLVVAMLACILWCATAGAECWRWISKNLPGPEWQSGGRYRMTYDENMQKLLLTAEDGHGEFQVWTYDGKRWELIWDEPPEMEPGWHYGPTHGLIFDMNLAAPVVFSYIFFLFPGNGVHAAFKFIPEQGWIRVGPSFSYGGVDDCYLGSIAVTYDTTRKRAILTGFGDVKSSQVGPPLTLEFDGANYAKAVNPPEMTINYGSMGYDPETRKTVFFGYGRECWTPEMETFEYDGTSWSLVETARKPLVESGVPSGLTYSPLLEGLLALSSSWTSFQTWIYKDRDWWPVSLEQPMAGRKYGCLGYDPRRMVAVYWGGRVKVADDVPISNETLEFSYSYHCRPVVKP